MRQRSSHHRCLSVSFPKLRLLFVTSLSVSTRPLTKLALLYNHFLLFGILGGLVGLSHHITSHHIFTFAYPYFYGNYFDKKNVDAKNREIWQDSDNGKISGTQPIQFLALVLSCMFFFISNKAFYNPKPAAKRNIHVHWEAERQRRRRRRCGNRKKHENKSITNFGRDGAHRFVVFRFRCRSYGI